MKNCLQGALPDLIQLECQNNFTLSSIGSGADPGFLKGEPIIAVRGMSGPGYEAHVHLCVCALVCSY